MTTQVDVLINAKDAENSQTTQYTSTSVQTIIDKFTVHNHTGTAATFACNLVPSGGSADSTNLFVNRTILPGETYRCPELVGQTLDDGDLISTIAGTATALAMRASGRIISS